MEPLSNISYSGVVTNLNSTNGIESRTLVDMSSLLTNTNHKYKAINTTNSLTSTSFFPFVLVYILIISMPLSNTFLQLIQINLCLYCSSLLTYFLIYSKPLLLAFVVCGHTTFRRGAS